MARYLILGGTGSLGKKLIERLLPTDEIAVYSRDEAKHWTIKNEILNGKLKDFMLTPRGHARLNFYVGDVRDKSRLRDVVRQYKPDTIIVAAALKQVDTCELSPNESVQTNLLGTQNIIDVVNESEMFRYDMLKINVLFVSTDKACSPVNVYGMCKAVSERIVTSQSETGNPHVKFTCVRYGNVLESRGSIIPLFKFQAEHADNLTVTDPNMSRFIMTLDAAVDLILKTLESGQNGETWIPKLQSMKIGDLAEIFAEKYHKQIKIIGVRPGEKTHEDLVNHSESFRTKDIGTHYVISPAYMQPHNQTPFEYNSSGILKKEELRAALDSLGIFDMNLNQFQGRSIEEISSTNK